MAKKIDTKSLVNKIDKITKERIAKEKVVSLGEYRKVKEKKEPISILVIDDDETIRNVLKRIFEAEGFKVIAAADGTQLSELLDDSPLDLIILDVDLPWINGYELCELMKENRDLKGIPLIFVSGHTSKDDIKQGFEVGADDYIKKPFDNEQIKSVVKTLLKLNT